MSICVVCSTKYILTVTYKYYDLHSFGGLLTHVLIMHSSHA